MADLLLPVMIFPSTWNRPASFNTALTTTLTPSKNLGLMSESATWSRHPSLSSSSVGLHRTKHFLLGKNDWMHSLGRLYSKSLLPFPFLNFRAFSRYSSGVHCLPSISSFKKKSLKTRKKDGKYLLKWFPDSSSSVCLVLMCSVNSLTKLKKLWPT